MAKIPLPGDSGYVDFLKRALLANADLFSGSSWRYESRVTCIPLSLYHVYEHSRELESLVSLDIFSSLPSLYHFYHFVTSLNSFVSENAYMRTYAQFL